MKHPIKWSDILFLDLETSGLNETVDRPLEVGVLLDRMEFSYAVRWANWQPNMPNAVWAMHNQSGLLHDMKNSVLDIHAIEQDILSNLKHHGYRKGQLHLAGFSIAFDRRFMARWMPDLHEFLHYRMVDVTSLQLIAAFAGYKQLEGSPAHRALEDCRAARTELARVCDHLGIEQRLVHQPEG